MKIILATPRGFCAGVNRAINIVNSSLEKFGAPIYVKHEIVHNKHVITDLEKKGVIFIEDPLEVPEKSVLIFSAHGVSPEIKRRAKANNLRIFDATCPLVTKIHHQVRRLSARGQNIILIGHRDHPEIIGTIGYFKKTNTQKTATNEIYLIENEAEAKNLSLESCRMKNLAYSTQTTLSVDNTAGIIKILKKRFPEIKGPGKDDICYATQNRQSSVRELAKKSDFVLIIGSKNSSNSNSMVKVARGMGVSAKLIDSKNNLDISSFDNSHTIGISSGASAPEELVMELVEFFKSNFKVESVELPDADLVEKEYFNIPKSLQSS